MIVARIARHRTTIVISAVAILVAAASGAAAAIGVGTITGAHVKNESLSGSDVLNSSLFSIDVRNGGLLGLDLKADTVTGREVSERSLSVPANISQSLAMTDVANAAAGAALADTVLLSRGDLALTGSCWRQTDTGVLHLDLQVTTRVNGSYLQSSGDSKAGGAAAAAFLNIDTAKADRQIASPDAAANNFRLQNGTSQFTAWAPGGDFMIGQLATVLQNGAVAGVTPPLAAGKACHVFGYVSAITV
ncbi:MAG: hypothetical protein JWM86_1457 [Thermoleophilia bacterium]|nr:hypothetical protein [Thermoleophilia bacterium]